MGAIPVHSELRQPRMSSSSASSSRTSARLRSNAFPDLGESALDRVAVDAAVLEVELVRPVVDAPDRVARHEPERDRLAAPAVLLAGPRLGELRVGRGDRARVLERLPFSLLPEDLVDGH